MHPLHHGGIHACSGYDFILRRAASKPAVALKAQTCAESPRGVFHPTLNEKMITKNLRNRAIVLQCLSSDAGFFWKTIKKIECCSVWIHSV